MDEYVISALKKKAEGFMTDEVVEEYVSDGEELKLSKRKVTRKFVPPDVAAIKALSELSTHDLSDLTDEELAAEKKKLLAKLKKADGGKNNGGKHGDSKSKI